MSTSSDGSVRLLESRGVPGDVAAALGRLQETLERAAGANLAGLVLYGGLARGRYRPQRSDVNVAVVLRDTSAESLAAIAPALQAAWRAVRVEPFIVTAAEVPRLAEVFPTKLLDIQAHHLVLAGEDPFHGLEIAPEHLRLHVRQQLHNLALRLRRRFVSIAGDESALATTLGGVARALSIDLATLLQLAGKPTPAEDRSANVFEKAAQAFGLDREALAQLAVLRHGGSTAGDLATLYGKVLVNVARAAETADQLGEVS